MNLERLSKIGKLMERTMADKDGSAPVVPLPPPPPPPFPEPPSTAHDIDPECVEPEGTEIRKHLRVVPCNCAVGVQPCCLLVMLLQYLQIVRVSVFNALSDKFP